MSDPFRFITINNSKKSGIVVRFVLPAFEVPRLLQARLKMPKISHAFARLIRSLNKTMGFFLSYYYVMITGLGLGIGISVGAVAVQFPMSVQANPDLVGDSRKVPVIPVTFESQNLSPLSSARNLSWITSSQIFVQDGSNLHSTTPILLYAGIRNHKVWGLADLELGSTLEITGENNGIYQFGVIGTRELAFSELFQTDVWYGQDIDLVFYAPDTKTPGYFRAVLAKRL
jgi:hypothetical protein